MTRVPRRRTMACTLPISEMGTVDFDDYEKLKPTEIALRERMQSLSNSSISVFWDHEGGFNFGPHTAFTLAIDARKGISMITLEQEKEP
jgi:hypothetical protein